MLVWFACGCASRDAVRRKNRTVCAGFPSNLQGHSLPRWLSSGIVGGNRYAANCSWLCYHSGPVFTGIRHFYSSSTKKQNQWACPQRILTKILSLILIDSSLFAVHPVDCVKLLLKCCQPSTGEWDFFCQVVALCTIKETKKKYSLNDRISSLLCWRSNFSLQLCIPGVLCRCCQVPCCRMRITRGRFQVST